MTRPTQAYPALERLRDEGVVTGIGVGTNFVGVADSFARQTDVDQVMIAGRHTLLDRSAEAGLLTYCAQRGIAVLVAGVFNSGLFADPTAAGTDDHAPAPADIVDRARRMQRACERHGVGIRAAALQFPLRHPAVTAIVSGAGTVASVTDTFAQLQVPIPEELWAELDELALVGSDVPP